MEVFGQLDEALSILLQRHRLRGAGHGGAHPALAFRESGLGAAHSPALHSPSSLHPRFAQDTQPTLLQGCPWPRAGRRAVPGCSCVLTTRSNPAQLLSQKHVSFQSHRSSVPAGEFTPVLSSRRGCSSHLGALPTHCPDMSPFPSPFSFPLLFCPLGCSCSPQGGRGCVGPQAHGDTPTCPPRGLLSTSSTASLPPHAARVQCLLCPEGWGQRQRRRSWGG